MQVIIAEAWGGLMDSNIIIAKPSNLIGQGIEWHLFDSRKENDRYRIR